MNLIFGLQFQGHTADIIAKNSGSNEKNVREWNQLVLDAKNGTKQLEAFAGSDFASSVPSFCTVFGISWRDGFL